MCFWFSFPLTRPIFLFRQIFAAVIVLGFTGTLCSLLSIVFSETSLCLIAAFSHFYRCLFQFGVALQRYSCLNWFSAMGVLSKISHFLTYFRVLWGGKAFPDSFLSFLAAFCKLLRIVIFWKFVQCCALHLRATVRSRSLSPHEPWKVDSNVIWDRAQWEELSVFPSTSRWKKEASIITK